MSGRILGRADYLTCETETVWRRAVDRAWLKANRNLATVGGPAGAGYGRLA
jgi:hypothetical protein